MKLIRDRRLLAACLALASAPLLVRGQDPGPLAPFQPPPNLTRTLRVWGHPEFSTLVAAWARGFRALQPECDFDIRLLGNGTAMPALYTGLADLALFGRDANTTDRDGFAHVLDYPHLAIEVATGGDGPPGRSPALVVFVHRDNPLTRLSLAQLDAIFGPERRRGAPRALRTWGDLGLGGEWRDQPIRLYADDIRTGTGQFFQRVVLLGSNHRHWEHFTEFKRSANLIGATDENGRQIADALRTDRFGLAVSTLRFTHPLAKALALGAAEAGPFFAPTRENLVRRDYPLARPIFFAVNRPPGRPLDPRVREFLRYVLSPAGQAVIAREGGWLPLSDALVREQLRKLD